MAEESERVALALHTDGFASLLEELDASEFPGIEQALEAFLQVVRETLTRICSQKGFRHVLIQETDDELQVEGGSSHFGIALGTPVLDAAGQLSDVANKVAPMDLGALLTASAGIPAPLGGKVTADEEGMLNISDERLGGRVEKLIKAVKPVELLQASITEEQEQVLVDALVSLAPPIEEGKEDEALEPVHPGDLLTLLVAYVADLVEPPRRAGRGNPLSALAGAVGGAVGGLVRRGRTLRKTVWRMEDGVQGVARGLLRLARASARPLLVVLVVNRALETLDVASDPVVRAARQTPAQQVESHFNRTLGKDWRQQLEQDFLDAAREVDEGLVTDDYVSEKRKMTAAMLRRLEVEDWDKERMRHFYYGSYGLGPWYLDMEERLHNPYFMGARAWNGPIEGWVGTSKAYGDSVARGAGGIDEAAFEVLESKKGIKIDRATRDALSAGRRLRPADMLLRSDLGRCVDGDKLRGALAGGQHS